MSKKNDIPSTSQHTDGLHKRAIRSFVIRSGRMTEGQQKAYNDNWEFYGLDPKNGPLDYDAIFGRNAGIVLEIGFGMGKSLVEMAKNAPDKDFIGIEVHTPGVAKLMMLAAEQNVTNIRVYCHDAIEVMNHCVPKKSISCLQLFFPDPWHKKRHNKRRIVQASFAEKVSSLLQDGGQFHMATDWEPYAHHMMNVMEQQLQYSNAAGAKCFYPRPTWRPLTKFEQRGETLGHGVWDLIYTKNSI